MHDPRGFTIVEVLVALLVLTVGLLATFSIFASVTRTFSDAHSSVEVSAHAAELLERVRGGGCSGPTAGSRIGGLVSYTWRMDEVNPQLRRVTVIVSSARVRARADTFSAMIPC